MTSEIKANGKMEEGKMEKKSQSQNQEEKKPVTREDFLKFQLNRVTQGNHDLEFELYKRQEQIEELQGMLEAEKRRSNELTRQLSTLLAELEEAKAKIKEKIEEKIEGKMKVNKTKDKDQDQDQDQNKDVVHG